MTARSLHPGLLGRTIVQVRGIEDARLVEPLSRPAFVAAVVGQAIREVGRRGKHLLLPLEGGAVLTVHLRMSGRLLLLDRQSPPDRHTRAVLDLDDGAALHFHDVRRFGRMRLCTPAEYAALDARLGPEPLEPSFTPAVLAARLQARRRARLKPLLLDQRFLAGLGNIYADEALFRAGLHPLRRAGDLGPAEIERFHRAIVEVLEEALAFEGTTLSDGGYRFGEGRSGRFAEQLRVYGRAGRPCPRCGRPLERLRIAGRGSHLCPFCQQEPSVGHACGGPFSAGT